MRVTIRMFASFREATGSPESGIDIATGTTVGQLWDALVEEYPRLRPLSRSSAFALNGRYTQPDEPLHEGDTVAFLPPVSGG